jgi:hypothetical protein
MYKRKTKINHDLRQLTPNIRNSHFQRSGELDRLVVDTAQPQSAAQSW